MSSTRMLATLLLTAGVTAIPSPASASSAFDIHANVASNGAATAWLSDTLMPSNRYLLTLTATGGGTCGIPGPTVQIVDTDTQGYANPVATATSGACTLYDATVVYTVTWTGRPGTSGQLPITCTWVHRVQQCSPTAFSIAVP